MAHSSMFRTSLKAVSAFALLMAATNPAQAAYKFLVKGPVCTGPNYCFKEFTGTGTVPISIDLPAYTNSSGVTMPALTFSGNLRVQQVASKLCKPGTGGKLEWLDQGTNVQGLVGDLTSGNYTMTLGFVTNATASACTQYGLESLSYSRTYTINQGGRTIVVIANGTYHVYNTATIPEPETLLLLVAGLGAMGLALRRKRG